MEPIYSKRTRYNKRTAQSYVLTDGFKKYYIGHKTDIQKLAKQCNKEERQHYGKQAIKYYAIKY